MELKVNGNLIIVNGEHFEDDLVNVNGDPLNVGGEQWKCAETLQEEKMKVRTRVLTSFWGLKTRKVV